MNNIKPNLVFSSTSELKIEIYFLNPGERFEGFGGSQHPLIVGDKASIVVRRIYGPHGEGGINDSEVGLDDHGTWVWIRRLISNSELTLATP